MEKPSRETQTLHKLLARQLNRVGLSIKTLPDDKKAWEKFLKSIDAMYHEVDQDRYTLERSMEISSNELTALNQKLQRAHQIARLGYWQYDTLAKKIYWSKELRSLMHLAPENISCSMDEFLQMFTMARVGHIETLIQFAILESEPFEIEEKITLPTGETRWFSISGQPKSNSDQIVQSLEGIALDITQRKRAEKEVEYLNQQLFLSARQAGMADVATTILHNVGNVLNGAIVSVQLLQEASLGRELDRLLNITHMLKDHMSDISEYLSQDPKGKLIPQYLTMLCEKLQEQNKIFTEEIKNLNRSLQHVKEIVATQNSVSKISDITEKVSLAKAIDTAIQMTGYSNEAKGIRIDKNYKEDNIIYTDRSKLIQILVNLIQNAKEAVLAKDDGNRHIIISTEVEGSDNCVRITVKDNGEGIKPENLTKIFSFGFTTKETGHGFGLHASSLAAKEMGGKLVARNDNDGGGAIFTLTIPTQIKEKGNLL